MPNGLTAVHDRAMTVAENTDRIVWTSPCEMGPSSSSGDSKPGQECLDIGSGTCPLPLDHIVVLDSIPRCGWYVLARRVLSVHS